MSFYNNCPVYSDFLILVDEKNKIIKFDISDSELGGDFLKKLKKTMSQAKILGSHQKIYYGAPGTGKSHETNKIVSEYSDTIRTTFHPDSDYSTFVGAYKPTTEKEYMYGLNGDKTVSFKDPSTGEPLRTSKIEYKFVKQAFIKAYIKE